MTDIEYGKLYVELFTEALDNDRLNLSYGQETVHRYRTCSVTRTALVSAFPGLQLKYGFDISIVEENNILLPAFDGEDPPTVDIGQSIISIKIRNVTKPS